jgi:hypothetical protein
MFAPSREHVVPYVRTKLGIQKVMITFFFTSIMLIVHKALPKGRKFNQNYFMSLVVPWLTKAQRRFTQKNSGAAFLLHMDISACHIDQRITGQLTSANITRVLAFTLLARSESLRLLTVWIPEEINETHGVNHGRSYC